MIPIDELLVLLQGRGIRVRVEDGALKYSAPQGALTPEIRAALVHHKPALLAMLRGSDEPDSPAGSIGRHPRPEVLPLSFAQERMWFLHQMEENQAAYNVFKALRFREQRLDIHALEQSLTELVHRHEALRTCFPVMGGVPCQRILEPAPHLLVVKDLQSLAGNAQAAQLQTLARAFGAHLFDLARGPLFRTKLICLAPDDHVLLLCMHHIVTDGWSLDLLFDELGELYQVFSTRRPSRLKEDPLQYADFTLWQREHLNAHRLQPLVDAWRSQLDSAPDAITLNTDKPRPPVASNAGGEVFFRISSALTDSIRALCVTSGTTTFMVLLAAYAVLLHRYSGMVDMVIGAPVANRTYTELEQIVGLIVNTLALRIDLHGDPSFLELLGRVRETAIAAYERQDLPFEILVSALEPDRDLSRNPLFQVMFAFQSRPSIPAQLGPLDVEVLNVPLGFSILDINLLIWESPEEFTCLWVYDSDLFERETAEQMVNHLTAVLEAVVSDPSSRLSALPLLSPQERGRLLEGWQHADPMCDDAACVHALVAAQAARDAGRACVRIRGCGAQLR